MAQRRMFNKTITNNDKFLEMPDSSQNLYFHLNMNADDDGFVDNWKSIMRMTGHKEDDLKVLIAKQYVIPFESGVIVIKHWRLNNYLQNDRRKPTIYQKELANLSTDDNNVYKLDPLCIHSIDQYSIEENSIEKNNIYIVPPNEEQPPKNSTKEKTKDKEDYKNEIEEILNYFNNCYEINKNTFNKRKQFNITIKNKEACKLITQRLKDGYTIDDFKDVIFIKYMDFVEKEYKINNKSSLYYYQPETLFCSKNFAKYKNEYDVWLNE